MKLQVLIVMAILQSIAIVILYNKVDDMSAAIASTQPQGTYTKELKNPPLTESAYSQAIDPVELTKVIRNVIAEELEASRQITQVATQPNKLASHPNQIADAQFALDHLISGREINDLTLASFEKTLVKLNAAERKQFLNQMTQRINQHKLIIQ